jgi:hypothetical protein
MKFTPRQRVAVKFPVMTDKELHPRYYRVTQPFQSILTFDVQEPPNEFDLMGLDLVDGKLGIWHGRVTKFPETPIAAWTPNETSRAKVILKRLVKNVGQEDFEMRESKDGMAFRVFRWATTEEVRYALRSRKEKRSGEK